MFYSAVVQHSDTFEEANFIFFNSISNKHTRSLDLITNPIRRKVHFTPKSLRRGHWFAVAILFCVVRQPQNKNINDLTIGVTSSIHTSFNLFNMPIVISQSTQASVILTPYFNPVGPSGGTSWRPA